MWLCPRSSTIGLILEFNTSAVFPLDSARNTMRREGYSFREFSSKKAFIQWRKTVDLRQLFFVDETGLEDFSRHYGRSPSNYLLPSFAPKVKPDKTCVINVVGFLELVQAIQFDTNAYPSSSLVPQFASYTMMTVWLKF